MGYTVCEGITYFRENPLNCKVRGRKEFNPKQERNRKKWLPFRTGCLFWLCASKLNAATAGRVEFRRADLPTFFWALTAMRRGLLR